MDLSKDYDAAARERAANVQLHAKEMEIKALKAEMDKALADKERQIAALKTELDRLERLNASLRDQYAYAEHQLARQTQLRAEVEAKLQEFLGK